MLPQIQANKGALAKVTQQHSAGTRRDTAMEQKRKTERPGMDAGALDLTLTSAHDMPTSWEGAASQAWDCGLMSGEA